MGKTRKRSQQELSAEARERIQDLPAETAAGRLEGGNEMMPEPDQKRWMEQMGGPTRGEEGGQPPMRSER